MNMGVLMRERERERRGYQEIRQGDDTPDEKPLDAITKKPHESSHEHHHPQRKIQQRQAGGPPESLAEIGSDGQVVELHLRDPKNRFESRRVSREIKVRARECLNPYCRHQYHPFT